MSLGFTRPDVKRDLPALTNGPISSRLPRVLNTPANTKSRSVSSHHLSSPSTRASSPSPLKPSVFSTPPRRHRYSASLTCKPLTPAASISSFRTCSESVLALSSPASPRTPRKFQASPPPSPSPRLPFTTRARATLAMSVQVHPAIIDSPSNHYHQPSPRQPQQNLFDMYPSPSNPRRNSLTSRPVSPLVNRPSSRSEKLLRDTLRRADEHDHAQKHPPFFLASALSPTRDDDSSDCDCDDIEGMLWRSSSGSSGDSADNKAPTRAQLVRNKSLDQKSPRFATGSPRSSRRSLHRSPNSAPVIIRGDEDMTPHDAVLRSRLEGVLGNAADQKRRSARSISRARAHTRDSSEDWTSDSWSPPPMYSQQLPPSSPRQGSISPMTPPPSPPLRSAGLYASPSYPSHTTSPSFNARTASARCRQIDGYVSFANVEGLGAPPEIDDTDEESGQRGKWLKWLGIGGAPTIHAPEYSARA